MRIRWAEQDVMDYIFALADKPEKERTSNEQKILNMAGSLELLNETVKGN